jgi:hypothetical protein
MPPQRAERRRFRVEDKGDVIRNQSVGPERDQRGEALPPDEVMQDFKPIFPKMRG